MKLDYIDRGSGPAVLLIHAFPLNNSMWAPQLPVLANRFRVIAPNVHPPSPWTMESMADALGELLDDLNVKDASVAGVSIGGYIAFAFWSKYPDRLRQLVLSNSRARADNDAEKKSRNDMIASIQQSGVGFLPDRMLPRLLQPNPNPEVARNVRSMIEHANPTACAYAVMAMRDRADYSSQLHRISCPTLVITGENDSIIRVEDARPVAEGISGAQFAVIPNSGHLSNLENPEAYNEALLSFLQ